MWGDPDELRRCEAQQQDAARRASKLAFPPAIATWRQALNAAPRGRVSARFNSLSGIHNGMDSLPLRALAPTADDARRKLTKAELWQVGFGGPRFALQRTSTSDGQMTEFVFAQPGMSFIPLFRLLRAWEKLHKDLGGGWPVKGVFSSALFLAFPNDVRWKQS